MLSIIESCKFILTIAEGIIRFCNVIKFFNSIRCFIIIWMEFESQFAIPASKEQLARINYNFLRSCIYAFLMSASEASLVIPRIT